MLRTSDDGGVPTTTVGDTDATSSLTAGAAVPTTTNAATATAMLLNDVESPPPPEHTTPPRTERTSTPAREDGEPPASGSSLKAKVSGGLWQMRRVSNGLSAAPPLEASGTASGSMLYLSLPTEDQSSSESSPSPSPRLSPASVTATLTAAAGIMTSDSSLPSTLLLATTDATPVSADHLDQPLETKAHIAIQVAPPGAASATPLAATEVRRTSSHHHRGDTQAQAGQTAPVGPSSAIPSSHAIKSFKTPRETAAAIESLSVYKSGLRWDRLLCLGFAAGIFVSLGGVFALTVAGGLPNADPGIVHLLFGLCFSSCFVLITLFGAEKFTGNVMVLTTGVLTGTIRLRDWARTLALVYLANFVGASIGVVFFGYLTDCFPTGTPANAFLVSLTMAKLTLPVGALFVRAIACNVLVCLAVWSALSAESIEGKILGAVVPITTFFSSSLDHCIPNMFFVPLGLLSGAPSNYGVFLYHNLLIVTLGNLVGGVCVALVIWWVYLDGRRPARESSGDFRV